MKELLTLENYQEKGKINPIIPFYNLPIYYNLSEEFMEHFKDNLNWHAISIKQKLSENFIEKFKDMVDWECICTYQYLSEKFITKFKRKVSWYEISRYQKLSEAFIAKFRNKVAWNILCRNQKLSEKFIKRFRYRVCWDNISVYQILSEKFITKYSHKLDRSLIERYQKLSEDFIKTNVLHYAYETWRYQSTEYKKARLIDTKLYECHEDYFIAYKGIRSDRYSDFNFQYKYEIGQIYETHADYSKNENSFGFSCWTEQMAKQYCDELIIKVKVRYEDIARVVYDGGKIRCCKFEVLT
jgi:hypothetical protein